ncbi:MAG TPA: helix-turn-helix transcriptional regulator [Xanthobacteraceae bacterium]|jgi:predicted XRE-type DNA-binding protein|nr:helix-turn-helix transcriptional regulator [Xanthobacteraceae bacterium]
MKKEDLTVTRGSGNVFADIGLPDADEHMLKAQIVLLISDAIKRRRLNQKQAASKMGIAQPDVSKILRGRFDGFSLERLLGFVRALGRDVEIKIIEPEDQNEEREGRLLISA